MPGRPLGPISSGTFTALNQSVLVGTLFGSSVGFAILANINVTFVVEGSIDFNNDTGVGTWFALNSFSGSGASVTTLTGTGLFYTPNVGVAAVRARVSAVGATPSATIWALASEAGSPLGGTQTVSGTGAAAIDVGLSLSALAAQDIVTDSNGGTLSSISRLGLLRSRSISAANASQVVVADIRNLSQVLDVISVTSAGTATLLIEVSADNVNFFTADSLIAAATNIKHYNNTTLGGTTAVSPLSFRFVRVTAGAAGVGNTTTLTINAK